MKHSGIPWIGEIPKEWELKRLKYLCSIQTGNKDTQDADCDGEYPFYVRSPLIERSTTYSFEGESILMAGDGVGAGRVFHHAFGKYAVHQRVYILSNITDIHSYYLFYYISNLFNKVMDMGSAQSTVPSVRLPMITNFMTCVPPLSEQQKIASFLDEKCSEIDEMVVLQEKIIEELKAYKQSVITEAVTKGLNPDVPMKDSGIEWIGEIPENWEVKSLKQVLLSPLQYGANESGILYNDNLPRYVRITDILDNSLKDNIEKQSLTEEQAKGYILKHNDILFARSGGTVGKSFIFDEKYGRCAFAGYLIKACVNDMMNAKYVYYFTQTTCYDEWKKQIFIQSTIQNIGADRYSQLQLCIPPLSEQQSIASYLDEKCSEIDSLISIKQSKIESLKEYKKSIIYEYVTGKKEVE